MEKNSSINERIKALERLLKDSDEGVRRKAAESLSRIEAIAEFDNYANMLNSEDRATKIQAIYLLSEIATAEVISLLSQQMDSPYDDVRAAVVQALGSNSERYIRSEIRREAVDVIRAGLGDLNLSVRASAAEALAKFKDPRSLEALMSVIKSGADDEAENNQLLVNAILALGEIGDSGIVQDIIDKAKTSNLEVKEAALKALGMLGDPRAESCLIEALNSSSPKIRMQAADSLGRI
jgi:HEAT repeat protein